MNIMVTGGAGFVGTNLIKRLLKDGHKVVSLDNYSTGKKENEQEGCTYYDCDIRDVVDFSYFMEKPDVIYHLGALARIQPSFKNPANTLEVGILGTMNILEWVRELENKPRMIFAGSSSVHSGKMKNPYTLSKVVADDLCLLYKKIYGVPTSICRFYNVYGPHQLTEGEYCTVLGIFQKQFKEGVELTITGDGEQRRDFTHVFDIVDGFIKAGENIDKSNGETFELGRGENFSINVIAQSFDCGYTYIPERKGEMRETLCTDMKARELLGWKPTIDVLDYIEGIRVDNEISNN